MKSDPSSLWRTEARCGSWRLAAGGALSLKPLVASRLQISAGRAWVTLNFPKQLVTPDWVLYPQDSLWVPGGRHLVMEAWPRWAGDELLFRWDPAYR
jgi:hypothetical protein